jgi:hypothetical protein
VKPEKDDPLFTPSPATYTIKDLSNKTPGWRISATKRKLTEINSKTPGSGKYEYKTFIGEGPKYSMRPKYNIDGITEGKRSQKAYRKTSVPGPGHYDPLDNTHGPKYTIGLKREQKNKKEIKGEGVPGVGSYNLTKDEDFKVPSYIISKEKRTNLNMNHSALNYPGPNKYTYDLEGASSKAPKWTFPKSERFGKPQKKPKSAMIRSGSMPGPGSYKTQYFIGHDGPIYSFPKEKLSHADAVDVAMGKKTMNYPSPTTYNTNIRYIPNSPIITMSKLKRKDLTTDKYSLNFPGPGHYHPNKYNSSVMKQFPVWSIHKSERDESKQGQSKKKDRIITPGPGHYNIKNGRIPDGPMFSMAKRLKKSKSQVFPGPGQYNSISVHFPSEPKYSLGKEQKFEENNKETLKKYPGPPGPGKYNVKDNLFSKGINFTKDKRVKEKKYNTPGPGQYRIPTAFDYINDYTRAKGIFDPTFKYV